MARLARLPLLTGVVVMLVCACPATAAPGDLVIAGNDRGVTTLGAMRPQLGATRGAAIRAFGTNYYVGRNCRFVWPQLGLTILMEHLGGSNEPCAFAQVAYISGPRSGRWRTTRGLRIGNTNATLRRLYPAATLHGTYWWLVRRNFPGIGLVSVISARVTTGRVAQLRVWIGGAGE
jgi:hypothetical protein